MIRLCFKALSAFWIVSPILYSVGWGLGLWRTGYDWAIGLVLVAISTFVCFLNYQGDR